MHRYLTLWASDSQSRRPVFLGKERIVTTTHMVKVERTYSILCIVYVYSKHYLQREIHDNHISNNKMYKKQYKKKLEYCLSGKLMIALSHMYLFSHVKKHTMLTCRRLVIAIHSVCNSAIEIPLEVEKRWLMVKVKRWHVRNIVGYICPKFFIPARARTTRVLR